MSRAPACPSYCECLCHDTGGKNHDSAICPPEGSAKWRYLQAHPYHRRFPLRAELKNIREGADTLVPGEAANVPQTEFLHEAVNRLLDAVEDVLELGIYEVPVPNRLPPQLWRVSDVKRTIEEALSRKQDR